MSVGMFACGRTRTFRSHETVEALRLGKAPLLENREKRGTLSKPCGQCLLLIFFLALRFVSVVVLNAGLNVSDRLLSQIQRLDAMPALISIRFLQFLRGLPQMLKSGRHVRLIFWSVL